MTGLFTNTIAESTSGSGITFSNDIVPATPLSHRNIVINGAMQVAQRGTSFTGFGASVNWSLDRFFTYHNSDGAFTISQESSVVPTGFKNSLKILITTADASITASQRLIVGTRFEGSSVSHLNFGTANAETITLSFYVRSSITGTHGAVLGNGSDNRAYPFTYTISSADTWERKSITIPGDQTGTWVTNNNKGMQIVWGLGVGTSFSASAGSWGAGDINSATGATTDVLGTVNSTWYLTGVQLELGTVATPFEHKSYGDELLRCQRYFYAVDNSDPYHMIAHGAAASSTLFIGIMAAPVTFRGVPDLTASGSYEFAGAIGGDAATLIITDPTTSNNIQVRANGSFTSGQGGYLRNKNDTNAKFELDAELG
tara:strand:+ start:629 stop:1741 length:1113 start_codon:yes stop_codon:yes gene_type:complete